MTALGGTGAVVPFQSRQIIDRVYIINSLKIIIDPKIYIK